MITREMKDQLRREVEREQALMAMEQEAAERSLEERKIKALERIADALETLALYGMGKA